MKRYYLLFMLFISVSLLFSIVGHADDGSGTEEKAAAESSKDSDNKDASASESSNGDVEVPAKLDSEASETAEIATSSSPQSEIPPNLGMATEALSFDYKEENLVSTRSVISKDGTCITWYLMYSRTEDVLKSLTAVFEADINGGDIKVAENPTTNSIVIRSKEPNCPIVKNMLDVISSLDFRPGQVLIDVLVVELSVTNDDLFDFELKGLVNRPLGIANAVNTTAMDFGSIDSKDPNSVSSGLKSFVTTQNKMKLFLNAYQKKEKANIISSPHIVAANHRKATFKLGSKIPLISGVRPSDAGPIKSFEIREVGIELNVTPHINRSNQIDLEVSQLINDIQSYDAKEGTARMSNREVTTNLTLNDNETLILGGFIENKETNTISKIPLISQIPLIGKLFQRKQKNFVKTELLIFLTPRVLDCNEDQEKVMAFQTQKLSAKDKIEKLLKERDIKNFNPDKNQEVIVDRASRDWKYGLNTKQAEILVWQIPQELEPAKMVTNLKGGCPFAFGPSKRMKPPFIRTLLEPSDGVIMKKEFLFEKKDYKSLVLKVASNNAAAVYLNGKLIDEDPVMKLKDGHDYEYWNRDIDGIPSSLLNEGSNNIVVLLGCDKSNNDGYFDMMLLGNKK
ncbi:MAG: hypothetical protein HQM10_13140 [Candidatus Riflebacteria bacterium]|nr:hypothetical protein [Candidatus Riflebacteria bacterium]